MISIFITVFIIVLLTAIMEIAASALRLTGMNIHAARFQALSALTGTGFTTREAEYVMNHKQRRIIVMVLMVIGPIGFIGILASVLSSLKEKIFLYELLAILVAFFIILRIFKSKTIGALFHQAVEHQIKKRKYFRKVMLDEVLHLDESYGVCEINIAGSSKIVGRKLLDTDFKQKGFMVLAIKRGSSLISTPRGSDEILEGDILVIFGNIKNIKDSLG